MKQRNVPQAVRHKTKNKQGGLMDKLVLGWLLGVPLLMLILLQYLL